ncbi:MAG: TonB-dependent receptor [Alphaproteobacteria bacterium]|nr:TonB-dependent receptor [Alphaproteobacteria bacterium]MBN9577734.1 TonB-dependent receptor [Alphaproteobacteria bacterium]
MSRQWTPLCGVVTTLALAAAAPPAMAQDQPSTGIETVVVTAQKVSQNINDVGMSITAASGDELTKLGITDTSQLVKVVPGFNYTPSFYGTPIYTIRGVGFLDTSLAASPTVSVYNDEVPLPYSIMTSAASLDIQRVEVLKGPQGTLFGENATGGAINFIANKPTDDWEAGADFSYGRFNTADLQGFVSGPITDTLKFRVAVRSIQSGDWQYSYTHPATSGAKNMLQGRVSFEWQPTDNFTALLTLSGFKDTSDTQMPALYGIAPLSPAATMDPRIGVYPFNQFGSTTGYHYPFAPQDPRAADWGACVNTSPFDPPFNTTPIGAERPLNSTDCTGARNDNKFFNASLRMDYNITNDLTLTSLTSHQRFDRFTTIEGDGTIYQDYESLQRGYIDVTYQELRLAGKFAGKGDWIFGGNYEKDSTHDDFLQTYGGSTASPTSLPGAVLCSSYGGVAYGGPFDCSGVPAGVPAFYQTYLGPTNPTNQQHTQTMAIYANGEYPILDNLTAQAGIRFTQTNKSFHGCGYDGGDGTWSLVSEQIQNMLQLFSGVIPISTYLQPGASSGGGGINVGPGACATTGPGPSFHPEHFTSLFNENNVSWRAGLNWKPVEDTLLYVNVSRGWKSGSFPTVATSAYTQLVPAKQEGLLAYEVGFKSTLLDNTLQLNGAVFYYDYKDKQILGAIVDPIFGPLPQLVNVPKSHVIGFELSGIWAPIEGLTITPSVSYVHSRVDGCDGEDLPGPGCHNGHYFNFDPFSQNVDLTGEPFPAAPPWQSSVDVQYQWPLTDSVMAYVGANVNHQASTNGFFYNRAPFSPPINSGVGNAYPSDVLRIKEYTLIDLRAGVEMNAWRVQVWGRNITNEYYWTGASHVNDVLYRYTGMPATYGFTVSYRFQ